MADDLTGLPDGLGLRPAGPDDRAFLLGLYATTRADELRPVPWSDDQKAAFVEMQFEAQDSAYRAAYRDGEFLIVLAGSQPIGRLYLGRLPGELRLIDITLTPEHRGTGIGRALIASVLARARGEGLVVTLHVEPWNPARRLYERMGFRTVELRGMYEFMRCGPGGQLKTAS